MKNPSVIGVLVANCVAVLILIAAISQDNWRIDEVSEGPTSTMDGANNSVTSVQEIHAVTMDDPDISPDCMTPDELDVLPLPQADMERIYSAYLEAETINSYRGLDGAALESLAGQGDSAAMAVRGAVAIMRAWGEADERAVPYLLHEDQDLGVDGFYRAGKDYANTDYSEAEKWLYRAAVYGRIAAFYEIADLYRAGKISAVDQGWISAEDFEQLDAEEQAAIEPRLILLMMYGSLDPMPQELQEFMYRQGWPRSELQSDILDSLVRKYHADRKANGLAPFVPPNISSETRKYYESLLCDQYK